MLSVSLNGVCCITLAVLYLMIQEVAETNVYLKTLDTSETYKRDWNEASVSGPWKNGFQDDFQDDVFDVSGELPSKPK